MNIFEILEHADKVASLAINNFHSDFTDQMWLIFSGKKEWILLYVLMAGFLIWRLGWKKGLTAILTIGITILCIDQFANLIKNWADRLRPCNDPEMIENGLRALVPASTRSCYGFFSAHAGNAMGLAVCFGYFLNKKAKHENSLSWRNAYGIITAVITVWALCVGVSRIFVGKHFLGDVIVGFIIGGTIAAVICHLVHALIRFSESRRPDSEA